MSPIVHFIFWASLANVGLAILVATRRSDRPVNQAFLFLNISIGLWLGCMWVGIHQQIKQSLDFWVRCTTGCALLMPLSLFLLARVTITGNRFGECLRQHWKWLLVTIAGGSLCGTRFFMRSVDVPADPTTMATPEYGPGFVAYVGWFVLAGVLTGITIRRARAKLSPIARLELGYITAGIILFNLLVVGLAGIVPIFWKASQIIQFATLWTIALDLVIAYGISTRKLLGLSGVARRIASYLVLIAYLGALYTAAWITTIFLIHKAGFVSEWGAYLAGAILTALSMRSAQSFSIRIVQKLFVNSGTIDAEKSLRSMEAIRSEILSVKQLAVFSLQAFARAAGTDSGGIRLFSPFLEYRLEGELGAFPPLSSAFLQELQNGPMVASILPRQSKAKGLLAREMKTLGAAIVIGIPGEKDLQGFLVLGERLTGKIYESDDVATLRIMAIHLATTLSNARLYLEKAHASIYQSTVLDQLAIGVIAVDERHRITAINREAKRILVETDAVFPTQTLEHIPSALREVIQETFVSEASSMEKEILLNAGTGNPLSLRVACRPFSDSTGTLLGASLTCQDVSSIKILEQQLIEADRMANLGQFSAIVAHEIKNPLVGIKTFAQLIPEKLGDRSFLSKWAAILNEEVDRIDAIVKQLLLWGKPSAKKKERVFVEDVLDGILALYRLELRKKAIKLESAWPGKRTAVSGDRQKLQQVFSNLILNAIQAMPSGGKLRLQVQESSSGEINHFFDMREPGVPPDQFLCVTVEDTGTGMSKAEIARLFEASGALISFKAEGSGFGLSIVKQIIAEHHGSLGVESVAGRGSLFRVHLPIARDVDPKGH